MHSPAISIYHTKGTFLYGGREGKGRFSQNLKAKNDVQNRWFQMYCTLKRKIFVDIRAQVRLIKIWRAVEGGKTTSPKPICSAKGGPKIKIFLILSLLYGLERAHRTARSAGSHRAHSSVSEKLVVAWSADQNDCFGGIGGPRYGIKSGFGSDWAIFCTL
jgi:hypothetical protein